MKSQTTTIITSCIISVALTLGILFTIHHMGQPTVEEKQIASYYANSVATLKSPHSLRREMDRGYHDFVVVDTRAQSDYENGHITGAINIDSDQDIDLVVQAFQEIVKSTDKPILIYCYSASCMNGRKVGNLLAQNGIYVHELTIGYNEWEFHPETWNYPQEAGTYDIDDYISRGSAPGEPITNLESLSDGCGVEGELSC